MKRNFFLKVRAFSLIELLITLVIIGILGAIAIPSYTSYMERSRRTDAKTALLNAASLMEQYFLRENTYTTDLAEIGMPRVADGVATTEDGTYQIIATTASTGAAYTLTAAPIGAQADDDCGSFTYDALGVKGVTGNATGETAESCW